MFNAEKIIEINNNERQKRETQEEGRDEMQKLCPDVHIVASEL